jgi:hypothetical protein
MSAEQDAAAPPTPPSPVAEDTPESLTDFMDRMDREAFHRALEQRDLRILATMLRSDG